MGKLVETFALFLTLLIALSSLTLLTVNPANAQTVPKPSVPEFTLRYVDHSYDVPPKTTTTIDPYTGNQIVKTQAGYRVYNQPYYLTIKNQPFTPYTDSNGRFIHLSYTFRWKGHYSDSWNNLSNRTAYFGAQDALGYGGITAYGDYTTIVLGLNQKENPINVRAINRDFDYDYFLDIPVNGTVNFQVQAFIGYSEHVPIEPALLYPNQFYVVLVGQISGWSSTQTITRPASSVPPVSTPILTSGSPTSSPIITPIAPDTNGDLSNVITLPLEIFLIIVAVVGLLAVALSVLALRWHQKTASLMQ